MGDTRSLAEILERIVVDSEIDAYIKARLDRVRSNDDLVAFFRRFGLYNLAFPGGVACLAGGFHVRSDLFRDRAEPIWDNADRSSIIASYLIFAAEDEFATRNRTIRITHRLMAQQLLKEVIAYAGWTTDQFNEAFSDDTEYAEKALALRNGYRIYSLDNEADLFSALGFHLGSERLADIEFNSLDALLTSRFPEFVAHAREVRGDHGLPLYGWVSTHTTVEVDHFEYSLRGAEQALQYYVGEMTQDAAVAHIVAGFEEFVSFQRAMFEWLR